MPKYAKPKRGTPHVRRFSHFTPVVSTSIENLSKTGSTKDENSSEDELLLGRMPRGSVSSAGPIFGMNPGAACMQPASRGGSDGSSVATATGSSASRLLPLHGAAAAGGESEATDDDETVSIPSAKYLYVKT